MASERLRDVKREETRRRLVEAADRMIGERGYAETTAADIALAAGVTERTFFRHFTSKGDVVIENWRLRAAAVPLAMRDAAPTTDPIDVVRAGLLAFAHGLVPDADVFRANVRTIATSRPLWLMMIGVLVELEHDIARELAWRLGRGAEDADVRIAANAAVGVLRAVMRAAVTTPEPAPLAVGIDAGLAQIAPVVPRAVAPRLGDAGRRR